MKKRSAAVIAGLLASGATDLWGAQPLPSGS